MEKKTGGCQGSCPLGKVLGEKECPGRKAKERFLDWLRGQKPKTGQPDQKPPKD
jgi:hypothetical protein